VHRRDGGSRGVTAAGARVTGLEVGVLLAYLAGKVLGQFEIFAPHDAGQGVAGQGVDGHGRLLLVAPNVVAIERELRVDPHDFRLWVCLHEETHRTQFTAVTWLREYVISEIAEFLDETDLDPGAMLRRVANAVRGVVSSIRSGGDATLLDLIQTPKQREILDRLTAVMSLVEGHAEYVMDGVGPQVIPTVAEIRARTQRRRESVGAFDSTVRRLLGLDAKLRQYRDGERFVRGVVDQVGMAGFNRAWESPATLPSKTELHDPAAWIARVGAQPAPEA
jgi:coenzyme F420 biosynthesis associated uncharacterized protein